LTDAGYVAGGYGVTVVAISAYVAHMWVRNRALTRATATRSDDGAPGGGDPTREGR
jgi:hypothetical protein